MKKWTLPVITLAVLTGCNLVSPFGDADKQQVIAGIPVIEEVTAEP
ncbi:hypothetical protein [Psychrosphaera algicola]|uniref:Lipoprotein n=2 Tax=Psychrosphaera TaxID=907197 RepID=A0ABT5FGD2_9GAMM|nr:hypothetical protein [Psychrosphaera sp. G1-22]MDC2890486.1 hypothetical protein [Psychrosphaera sp. G1-22]